MEDENVKNTAATVAVKITYYNVTNKRVKYTELSVYIR
jgi:hypothetical protein